METEIVKMFGRLFEQQIKQKFTEDNRKFISQVLKYRSDLEYFKHEDRV